MIRLPFILQDIEIKPLNKKKEQHILTSENYRITEVYPLIFYKPICRYH